uniref:Uncharacterized protein n=1 Tax=Pyrodinium bahamense TaxID=73915 RepID=A0A7S0FDM5_9DINO|mmetsp:Transcript_23914/g.66031  ORF Transcript_23914/g.66031 Transcript_23914/m.66031 type:complete len:146 (+) Transcript_23914:145-582(+)
MRASGRRLIFHLHATPRFGTWDGKGVGSVFELVSREVWQTWAARLAEKEPSSVPTFCKYGKPLHALVTYSLLASGNPVAIPIGSPDFVAELLAVGDVDPEEDVMTYYCGNPFLQKMVQTACIACNEHRTGNKQSQRYYFTFERFG